MLQKSFNAGAQSVHSLFADRTLSYSQDGEDVTLDNFLRQKSLGFYIDVGAYHPQRFSNTKLFYDIGWQGINIEPNPEVVKIFKEQRPRDLHLCMGVAKTSGNLKYYQFSDPALSTFSDEIKEHYEKTSFGCVIQTIEVPCVTLNSIFEKYVQGRKVDFLSIDVEGLDFAVLCSNDWEKYRPDIVLMEFFRDQEQIITLMNKNHYKMVGKTAITAFFASAEFLEQRKELYSW